MTIRQDEIYTQWCMTFSDKMGLSVNTPEYTEMSGTVGLEGAVIDMPKFTNYVSGFMAKITSIFADISLIPIPFIRSELDTAVARLYKAPRIVLDHFTVVTPEYLSKDMPDYLQTLQDVLTQLLTIEKRLLTPLDIWCEKMLTDKEFANKAWLMLPPLSNEAEVHQNTIKQYFNNSVGKGIDNKKFMDMYAAPIRFKEAGALIDELNKLSHTALGSNINKRAKSISSQIDRISKDQSLSKTISELPSGKIATISALTYECAKQMEMMAIVLYQIRVAGQSFKESVQKINKEL